MCPGGSGSVLDMAQFGSEVLVLQAVQRGGRVHTACLHTSIAVTGRHTGSYGGGGMPCQTTHTRAPLCLVFLVVASSRFLHLVNGVL